MKKIKESKNVMIKYWILIGLSKSRTKRGVDVTKLFSEEKPDFIELDLNNFFRYIRMLEREDLIKMSKSTLTPAYYLTEKGQKELRKNEVVTSKEYNRLVKFFPEIDFRYRIEQLEGFVFSIGILVASYLSLTRYNIINSLIINGLLGVLLLSFGLAGAHFITIANFAVEKYKLNLIVKLKDAFEENKYWIGYGLVLGFTILGVFILKKLGYTDNQIMGGIILEIIFLLMIKADKINKYLKSITLSKK